MNKTIMPFLLGIMLVAAGCSTNSQNKSNAASMSSAFGNGYTIHGDAVITPQPIDRDVVVRKREEDRADYLRTRAYAKDLLKKSATTKQPWNIGMLLSKIRKHASLFSLNSIPA